MYLKSLPGVKSGFFVYTTTHTREGKLNLSVYLLHSQTDELFVIDMNDSVQVVSRDIQIGFSPRKIADIMENSYERVGISEMAEMEIQLDVQKERVKVKLPPPRRDDTLNAAAEIRIRHIKRGMNERISLLEEEKASLQVLVESLQMDMALLGRELRQQSQKKWSELSPLLQVRKSSSTIDEKTQGILRQYQENRQFTAMLTQQIEHAVQNTLHRDSQRREDMVNHAIQRASASFSHIVDRSMREIYGKIEAIEQKLQPVGPKIEQKRVMKGGQVNPFAYFQAEVEESQYNSIQTTMNGGRVQIRNNQRLKNEENDLYCYFFSKPPITHTLTLHLKVRKGEKPLFGICSKEALQARPIYQQSTAFFYILSDEKCWLAGQEQDDCGQGGRVEGGDEAVMRVSVEEGVVVWESQGKVFKHQFDKDFLSENQLHVAVLMKREDENEVQLQYYH